VIEEAEEREVEGIMKRMIKIGEERWRIIGMYANGNVREKWEKIREWVEEKGSETKTIVGGDFNARTGKQGGRWESGMEGGDEGGRKSKDKKVNRERRNLIEALE